MSFLDKIKDKLPNRSHDEDLEEEFDDEIGDDEDEDEEEGDDEASESPIARIINQIKQKFSKNDDDEEEDDDEEDFDSSDDNTTQINVNRELLESDDEYDEDDEDEDEEEDEDDLSPLEQIKQKLSSILPGSHAKNGKKSKISPISALVILGLVYLGLDMFSDKKTPPVQIKHKKVHKQNSRVSRVKRERKKVVTTPTPTPIPSPMPQIEKKDTKVTNIAAAAKELPKSDVIQSKKKGAPLREEEKSNTKDEPKKVSEDSELDVDDMLSEITDEVSKSKEGQDTMANTKQKTSEVPYVKQPRYDLLGRGLVYNCQKGYWACVDKSSFFQCKDNFSWAQKSGKPLECVPREVYATIRDCRVVQVYNINTAVKATFCNPK